MKKTVAESHRMLVEAYGEHALGKSQCFEWFKKFRSGNFDARNEERGRPPKKFRDSELQASLDEDDAQTQRQLADQLNVTREAVSMRSKTMGKIQKVGKWVPHEPNERQQENRKTTCEMLLAKESHFFTELWLAMKSGYIQLQANHRHRLQDQIAMDGRQCPAFGGIRRVWSIMSC